MTRRDKLAPSILAVIILTFAVWCVNGLHFGKHGFDPRADENSEGQCP
jgi:hypothetical protein